MPVIVAKPRLDGNSDYYDDRNLISVSLARNGAIDRPAFVDTQADWRRI